MTKLVQVDKVGAVVGAFGSSISTAAIAVAAPAEVVMVSPGSTSPYLPKELKMVTLMAIGIVLLPLTPIRLRPWLSLPTRKDIAAWLRW
jgi:hypothetical protein